MNLVIALFVFSLRPAATIADAVWERQLQQVEKNKNTNIQLKVLPHDQKKIEEKGQNKKILPKAVEKIKFVPKVVDNKINPKVVDKVKKVAAPANGGNGLQQKIGVMKIQNPVMIKAPVTEKMNSPSTPSSRPATGSTSRPVKMKKKSPTEAPHIRPTTPIKSPTSAPKTSLHTPTKSPTSAPKTSLHTPTKSPTSAPKTSLHTPTGAPSKRPSSTPSEMPSSNPTLTIQNVAFEQAQSFSSGQAVNMAPQGGADEPLNRVCGAIQTVLPHPTNEKICFAGGTNGGVWRTKNCTDPFPIWEPLTDSQESNSIGDMAYDLSDPTGNTLAVAIGTRSSFRELGGVPIGILYTQNALASKVSWTVLDNSKGTVNFRTDQVKFNSVFVRGDLMLASAYSSAEQDCLTRGIFRSTNRGATWTNVLSGVGRVIASDPINLTRFYAVLDYTNCTNFSEHVFTSANNGTTWAPTTGNPSPNITEGTLLNAKIAVSAINSRVWVGLIVDDVLDSISYSDNKGVSWKRMDDIGTQDSKGNVDGLHPGSQGHIHFSMQVSPSDSNIIFAGGDRQDEDFTLGAQDLTGRFFRGNATVNATGKAYFSPQWEHITDRTNLTDSNNVTVMPGGGTANSSAPHADSRDIKFRADGYLLEGDDGGIAARSSPKDNKGDWFGLCGNLIAFEAHSIDYEPIFNSVVFGTQDNGSIYGRLGGGFTQLTEGDGNDVAIDYKSDPNNIYVYTGAQNFQSGIRRHTISKTTGNQTDLFVKALPGVGQFLGFIAMNPSQQNEIAVEVGNTSIAISRDYAQTFSTFASDLSYPIRSMTYSFEGKYLYVTDGINVARCQNQVCATVGAIPVTLPSLAVQLAVDPTNSSRVLAASANFVTYYDPGAYYSTDGGVTWKNATVQGSLLDKAGTGGSAVFIRKGKGPEYVPAIGTSSGVLIPNGTIANGTIGNGWKHLATGVPNVIILDMVYNPTDDILVIATLGRGIWFLKNASAVVNAALVV